MSVLPKKRLSLASLMTPERIVGAAAVAITAAGLMQPSVLQMAGLSFDHKTQASQGADPTPTGAIPAPAGQQDAAARRREAIVHGLSGALRALRARE